MIRVKLFWKIGFGCILWQSLIVETFISVPKNLKELRLMSREFILMKNSSAVSNLAKNKLCFNQFLNFKIMVFCRKSTRSFFSTRVLKIIMYMKMLWADLFIWLTSPVIVLLQETPDMTEIMSTNNSFLALKTPFSSHAYKKALRNH